MKLPATINLKVSILGLSKSGEDVQEEAKVSTDQEMEGLWEKKQGEDYRQAM